MKKTSILIHKEILLLLLIPIIFYNCQENERLLGVYEGNLCQLATVEKYTISKVTFTLDSGKHYKEYHPKSANEKKVNICDIISGWSIGIEDISSLNLDVIDKKGSVYSSSNIVPTKVRRQELFEVAE